MSDTKASTAVPAGDSKPMPKKRSWRWRFFRFVVLSFAAMVTLFALFHAEENWRGKRAWEQYREEQEAKGVSFDYNSVVPPPVPEEKNFAMTPLLKPLLELNPPGSEQRRKDTNGVQRVEELSISPQPWSEVYAGLHGQPVWTQGKRLDLEKWQTAIFASTNLAHPAEPGKPAEDVIFALKQYDPAFTELRQAARERPHSRFDIKYEEECKAGILLPHLAQVKGISRTLQLRIAANLSLGKTEEAFADVNLIFTLADSIESEPVIISKLVRHACFSMATESIWEGLLDHRWKAEHLMQWQERMASYDFIKDGYHGVQGERAFGNSTIEFMQKYPELMGDLSGVGKTDFPTGSGNGKYFYKLIPKGWFHFEQINYNRLYEEFLLGPSAKDKSQFDIKNVKQASDKMDKHFTHRDPIRAVSEHKVLTYVLLPSMSPFVQRCAYAQSTADLAIVALALERYHLKQQDYPAALEALVPDYVSVLPTDIMAKAPFKYERQSRDAFRLWSVGWNETDEGGKVKKVYDNGARYGQNEGDWTWPQVEKDSQARESGFE